MKRQNCLVRVENMLKKLRMRCKCGHWNSVPVKKLFFEQPSPEPKVHVMVPMYKPLHVSKCERCGKTIADPKELIRIVKNQS
jgi:DNA-directed RNA polymerase subunit RPC12/RpoP